MVGVGIIEMGIPMDVIHKAIISFKAVEHRIEYVDTIDGVSYYNDSKDIFDASLRLFRCEESYYLNRRGFDKAWLLTIDSLFNIMKCLVLMETEK